eukprot:764637-Hanusia_phi.AAC.1
MVSVLRGGTRVLLASFDAMGGRKGGEGWGRQTRSGHHHESETMHLKDMPKEAERKNAVSVSNEGQVASRQEQNHGNDRAVLLLHLLTSCQHGALSRRSLLVLSALLERHRCAERRPVPCQTCEIFMLVVMGGGGGDSAVGTLVQVLLLMMKTSRMTMMMIVLVVVVKKDDNVHAQTAGAPTPPKSISTHQALSQRFSRWSRQCDLS